ncbi:MAG TPA: HAD-IIIA family hydrolase [Phycisphaerae bacterium]|nr:HAD-IIIA family hydrolase [Phycisphaerae bacterium]
MSGRAVFFNRDGTIIPDSDLCTSPQQARLLPGVGAAIKRLRQAGFKGVMVTNQPAVASGLLDEQQLSAIHERLQTALAEQGAGLDAVYACSYAPGPEAVIEQYRRDSDLIKPGAGMLRQAAAELDLDLSACWVVGSKVRDVEAGRTAGCRTILIGDAQQSQSVAPDFAAADLAGAVEIIVRQQPGGPTVPAESQDGQDRIERQLAKVAQLLEQQQRSRMYQDFSLAKLTGAVVQMVAIGLFGWGMLATVDGRIDAAFVRLLSAVFMQLLATTLFLLHRHS